jgi:hypothetical protein
VFVAHLNRFLGGPEDGHPHRPSPGFPRELLRGEPDERWEQIEPIASVAAELKMRIQKALAEGDDGTADLLLDELIGHRERLYSLTHERRPEAEIRSTALSEDPFTLLLDFYSWAGREPRRRAARRAGRHRALEPRPATLVLAGDAARDAPGHRDRAAAMRRLDSHARQLRDRRSDSSLCSARRWRVALQIARFGHRWKEPWPTGEIVHALRVWSEEHGPAPRVRDWKRMTPRTPQLLHRAGSFRQLVRGTCRRRPHI